MKALGFVCHASPDDPGIEIVRRDLLQDSQG